MFYLFHHPDKRREPDYIRGFRTRKNLELYVSLDRAMLKKEYPEKKWPRSDYMVARRVK